MDCAALIPCCNEAASLGPIVRAVQTHLPRAIVVDDGSTDATAEVARAAGAELVVSSLNRGKGAAMQLGFRHAAETGCAWVLLLDGDGQHSPEDLPAFLAALQTNGADLVIGNRLTTPEAMPPVRRAVNRLMSAIISRLCGTTLPDTQCGFRLVRLSALNSLTLHSNHFEIESEMLVTFLAAGRVVEFLPVRCLYKSGRSKIQPLRDTVRWLRWLWSARGACAQSRVRFNQPLLPPGKLREIFLRIAGFVFMAFLMGAAMDLSARHARPDKPAGFCWGVIHGALMPTAMPTLFVGRDVTIYAPFNTGVSYKLGYTMGVNGCGAIFFGLAFWRPRPKGPNQ